MLFQIGMVFFLLWNIVAYKIKSQWGLVLDPIDFQ